MLADLLLNIAPGWSWVIVAGLFFAIDLSFKRSPFLWLGFSTLGAAFFTYTMVLNAEEQMGLFALTSWMAIAWWYLQMKKAKSEMQQSEQTYKSTYNEYQI